MFTGKIVISEEKLHKLKPIFESILSRKYGREVKFITLTMGNVTIGKDKPPT